MPQITPEVHSGKDRVGTSSSRSNSSARLAHLETAIRTGQADYAAVGAALTEIQSSRLYKPQYNTFEEYCEKQWGFSRQTAYDYIHAASVVVRISVQNPPSLAQAVELSRLTPEQQETVAADFDFKTATVKEVKTAVDEVLGKEPAPKPKTPKETALESALDAFVLKIVMQPYGYYAAKFATYSFQHSADLTVIEKAKVEVYQQIAEICATKLP
jgi:hypothetical protein